jgi:MFS family permease
MWLVKGIVGLFFIFLAMLSFVAAFQTPTLVIFSILFASLGLWIMGWVSIYSPRHIQEKDAQEEAKARKSKYFGFRNRLMGLVAIAIGGGVLYAMYGEFKWENWMALLGAVVMLVLGIVYFIRGKHAEPYEPRTRNEKERKERKGDGGIKL